MPPQGQTMQPRDRLQSVLLGIGPSAIAVSGGVDSMTLAVIAARLLGPQNVTMLHAVSPAVPPEATGRVRSHARTEGWDLVVIDAREFADRDYVSNPVNRCFFCKNNLYGTIAHVSERQVLSGTNTDDLGEYRPGLKAAEVHKVRHPYVEAGLCKKEVRALARDLGLHGIAELPASPCLSSRVETLIPIEAETLRAIHAIERLVSENVSAETVRCRVRKSGIVIEIDSQSLNGTKQEMQAELSSKIAGLLPATLAGAAIGFAPYRNGSAFVGQGK